MTSNTYVMPNLAFVKNNQVLTTTYALSQWANREHRGVFQIVTQNIDALKRLGEVSFEMKPVKTKSGTQTFRIATLNEDQASFVICSMRNNEQAKNFKVELLLAFRKCREQLAKQNQRLTDKETENISMTEFSRGANIIRDKYANKIVTTGELVSENNNFAFGISKNSLIYEYLKVMRKIKANKEQWQQEVEEFNAVVGDACELSENCEKIKV
nr:MAG TPA: regulatory protein [Caudoviricetes sp.]